MKNKQTKAFLFGLSISAIILISFFGGALADRIFVLKPLNYLFSQNGPFTKTGRLLPNKSANNPLNQPISSLGQMMAEGSLLSVADVAEKASESVVTVSIKKQQQVVDPMDLFGGFFGFGLPRGSTRVEEIQRDIGTGFVIEGGLIITNRHVVADLQANYKIIDKNDKEYEVKRIYRDRDPGVDLAILQVEGLNAPALEMGDSDTLRVGEGVIAIGTALGQFRHTVTTGVISGLGRGITAGDGMTMYENLQNVIQTDAAINPGNSGGPLLNSKGQVIGVNVATATADNISFALPINLIKTSLDNFNATGQFDRPLLGIRYQNITQQAALFNEVPQGAYLLEVAKDSSADLAGLKPGDIITQFDGQSLKDQDLATLINKKKIGDKVKIKFWRNQEEKTVEVVLKGGE